MQFSFDFPRYVYVGGFVSKCFTVNYPPTAKLMNGFYAPLYKTEFIFPFIKEMPGEWEKKVVIGKANALVRKYLFIAVAKAGIDKHVHFHMARHTFATTLARNNTDIGISELPIG